jgi:ATP-dependent Clp protease ATP-binding subunit ClpA
MATRKKSNKPKTQSLMGVVEPWLEMDLTAAAKAGALKRAFEVDDILEMVGGLLDAGRNPVLVGDRAVGKTAVVHELARRAQRGDGPARLQRVRILQLSIQRRASSLKEPYLIREEMQKLVEAVRRTTRKLALFIRDLSLAYEYDLESQIAALAYAFRGPLLAEGTERDVSTLLESDSCLRQHFMTLRLEEPSYDRSRVIVRAWAQERCEKTGQVFSTAAVEHALHLAHRFLTRGSLPSNAIEILDQSATPAASDGTVTERDVFDRFCAMHRTPRVLVDPAVPLHIDRLKRHFTDRVAGQADAIDVVIRMISVIKAGLSDDRRPLGVFLWTGPTGVGKTYMAQLLTEHLFGHRDRMVRLNMADFQGSSDANTLFGAPGSHYDHERAGILSRRLLSMPFGLVLLDEFEKAHGCVHDRFLQLFDEGTFINGENETVSCRSWILVATSNAGWEETPEARFGFTAGDVINRRTRADIGIERHFRPELLNRFDRVVHFMPLDTDDFRTIAGREIERLSDRIGIEQRQLILRADAAVIDWILTRGDGRDQGARFLRREIEDHVTGALADLLVRTNAPPGATIMLVVEDDRIVAKITGDPEAWQPGRGRVRSSQEVSALQAAGRGSEA